MIFANDCRAILKYTKNVLNCDIHTRVRTKRLLKAAGADVLVAGSHIFSAPDPAAACKALSEL